MYPDPFDGPLYLHLQNDRSQATKELRFKETKEVNIHNMLYTMTSHDNDKFWLPNGSLFRITDSFFVTIYKDVPIEYTDLIRGF